MKDFIIDLETLGNKPNAIVVDLSVLVFDADPRKVQSFDELVKNGRRFKLSLESQKGVRSTTPSTIKFWKEQSPEAKENLKPSDIDMTVEEAIPQVLDFLKKSGIDPWKSQGWCRGMSFDFPIFVDMIRQTYQCIETEQYEPVKFWAQRDIRTAIESLLLSRGTSMMPLRKGVLDGFVHHDSVHDCAKDVIMLKSAMRFALGLDEMPKAAEIDEQTIKPKDLEKMFELEKG